MGAGKGWGGGWERELAVHSSTISQIFVNRVINLHSI